MLHHASRRADLPLTSLSTILQAAASRAWVRTRPVRSLHRGLAATQAAALPLQDPTEGESSTSLLSRLKDGACAGQSMRLSERVRDTSHAMELAQQDWPERAEAAEDDSTLHTAHFIDPTTAYLSDDPRQPVSELVAEASAAWSATTRGRVGATRSCDGLDGPTLCSIARDLQDRPEDPFRAEVFPTYEDDPPWPEVIDSKVEAEDTPATVVPCLDPTARPFSPPQTKKALYTRLFTASQGAKDPVELVNALISYHAQFPDLQGDMSFNFLISLAISSRQFATARRLFDDMAAVDRKGNLETRKLWTRLRIRLGRWEEAWEDEVSKGPLPLPVWLEFFGTIATSPLPGTQLPRAVRAPEPACCSSRGSSSQHQQVSNEGEIRRRQSFMKDNAAGSTLPIEITSERTNDSNYPVDQAQVAYSVPKADYGDWDPPSETTTRSGRGASPPYQPGTPSQSSTLYAEPETRLWNSRRRDEAGQIILRPRQLPPHRQELETARFQALMRNYPALSPAETAQMPPRVIRMLVQWHLRMGNRPAAFNAASTYFRNLPRQLTPTLRRQCLEIVHFLLVSGKAGRAGYQEARATFDQLLSSHPELKPDSTTLLYLISSLRDVPRCGTLASNLVQMFQRRWGAETVDNRVLWRLAWLGLKERNVSVAESAIRRYERERERQAGLEQQRGLSGGAGTLPERSTRPSLTIILGSRDAEEDWEELRARLLRLQQRNQQGKGGR